MSNRKQTLCTMLAATLAASAVGLAQAQEAGGEAAVRNMAQMKFAALPGMPACVTGSVQHGDPAQGASLILAKVASGCTIPWHWHTATEHVMLVSGAGHVQMKDGKPVTVQAGAFADLPAKHAHQFHCTSACALYIHSDTAFDIHYVDAQGKEISPDEALKAAHEKAPHKT